MFYSCYFSFSFESRSLVTSVTTPFYLYFIAFGVPSKVLVEVGAKFGFLRRNRFFVHQLICHAQKTIRNDLIFFSWSLYVYETLIILAIFNLSHGSASKQFVFTDCSILTDSAFSFAFSLLQFFVWFSLLEKALVAVANVPKCWLCLCHCWTWEFLIMH